MHRTADSAPRTRLMSADDHAHAAVLQRLSQLILAKEAADVAKIVVDEAANQ